MNRPLFPMYDNFKACFFYCLQRMVLVSLFIFFFLSPNFLHGLILPDQFCWALVMQIKGKGGVEGLRFEDKVWKRHFGGRI